MPIKIKIYAPAFVSRQAIDEFGYIHLPDGSSLRDVYALLKIPWVMHPVMMCTVNYDHSPLATPLKDGDTVSFIFPISGG
jgi:molybdopterin converting factor small subunit